MVKLKVFKQLSAAILQFFFTCLALSAAVCRKREFLYVCVRTGRPIKHIGAEDGAVCPEGQPRQTSKFFG